MATRFGSFDMMLLTLPSANNLQIGRRLQVSSLGPTSVTNLPADVLDKDRMSRSAATHQDFRLRRGWQVGLIDDTHVYYGHAVRSPILPIDPNRAIAEHDARRVAGDFF